MQAPVAVRCFTNCYTLPLPFKRHFSRSSNELQTVEWYTISWLTFAARRYAYRDLCRRASVRLSSVTFVYWKRNKRIVKLFLSRIAPCTILVFFRTKWQYLDWDPLTGASNTGGYKKISTFRPVFCFISEIIPFGVEKLEWCGYLTAKRVWGSAVSTEYRRVTDRQTNRQTSCDSIFRAMHSIAR